MTSGNDKLRKCALNNNEYDNISYYIRRLSTKNETYAHVFTCDFDSAQDLRKNWESEVNYIAYNYQSEVPSILERSNFYIFLFVNEEMDSLEIKRIENDTYCARKFVIITDGKMTEKKKKSIIENRVFSFDLEKEKDMSGLLELKSIQLNNFRAYRGEKSISFEKNDDSNEIAKLIALYAPNGVGKTSIFDAFEWATTDRIDRFDKLIKNKELKDNKKKIVLKNTETDKGEKASVAIEFSNHEKTYAEVRELIKNTRTDYGDAVERKIPDEIKDIIDLKDKSSNNKRWQKVFLSHNRIDDFMVSDGPRDLYNEWGDLMDPEGKIRQEFVECHKKCVDKNKELETLQQEIKVLSEHQLKNNKNKAEIERILVKIADYNNKFQGKMQIPSSVDGMKYDDYEKLMSEIDSERTNTDAKLKELEARLDYIKNSFSADKEQLAIYKAALDNKIKEEEQTKHALSDIKQKKYCIREEESSTQEYIQKNKEYFKYKMIFEAGQAWYDNAKLYFATNEVLNELNKKNTKYLQNRIEIEKRVEDNKLALTQKQKYKEGEIEKIDEVYGDVKQLRERIALLQQKKDELKSEIENRYKEIRKIKASKELIKLEDELLTLNEYNQIIDYIEKNAIEEDLSNKLIYQVKQLQDLQDEVFLLEKEIRQSEKNHEQYLALLKAGRMIIKSEKNGVCPLCKTKHSSWKELEKNIDEINEDDPDNTPNGFSVLMNKKINSIKKLTSDISKDFALYNDYIEQVASKKESEIEAILKTIEKKHIEIQGYSLDIEEYEQKIKDLTDDKDYSDETVFIMKNNISKAADLAVKALCEKISADKEKLESLGLQQKENDEAIAKQNDIVSRCEKTEDFNLLLNSEDIICNYSFEEMTFEKDKLRDSIGELEARKVHYRQIIDNKEIDIKNEVPLNSQLNKIKAALQETKEKHEELQNKIRTELALNSEASINEVVLDIKGIQGEIVKLKNSNKILNSFKFNPTMKTFFEEKQMIENELNKKQKEYADNTLVKTNLDSEYKESKNTLEKNMQDIIKTYRISDIYEKLDPHIKFKKLKFEFDFYNDEPILRVCVSDKAGANYPPEWYFSTAQLNIVAFSIFLGKAMIDKDVPIKSILIDDPIDHFDDINIVGFVDLLRSIIENTDRQIIISTHDSRIYNLLQRKIPTDEYNSKYIDCRTIINE